MTWLDELTIDDLQGDYADLVAVIGLEATVQFATDWYGGELLLPRINLQHPDQLRSGYCELVEYIGFQGCIQVEQCLGGNRLYLPQAGNVFLAAKTRYVLKHDRRHNRRKLARDTKLSLRQIYRICEGKTLPKRTAVHPDQLSLL